MTTATNVHNLSDTKLEQVAATGSLAPIETDQQQAISKLFTPQYFEARKQALAMAATLESINGRCLNDQVLILRASPEVKYGCIIIPDTAQEKTEQGIVVAVGPGFLNDDGKRIPLGVQVGEGVKFSKYYGTPVKIGGMEFLQLRECEIEFAAGVPRTEEEKQAHDADRPRSR